MGGHFQHFKSVFDGLIADSQAPHISLQLVLDAVVNIFPFAAAVIYLADFKNDELVCVAQVGSDAIGDSAGPPRIKIRETSLVSRVFREGQSCFIREPWANPISDPRGVQFFQIQSPVLGVPLKVRRECLGVLLLWKDYSGGLGPKDMVALEAYAELATSYLALAVGQQKHTAALQGLFDVLSEARTEVSQERAVMAALREFPFDRARLFEYKDHLRSFLAVDCFGMQNPQAFLESRIPINKNPYAAHLLKTFTSQARIYDPCNSGLGVDPDAEIMEKPFDMPWVSVPLVLNGELIGQLVVDNARSRRAITQDALEYLNTVSALAVGAIANRRSVQFLSLDSLPVLYNALALDRERSNVIKRLLLYATCGEALGFSRALFLEYHEEARCLVYRTSIGSLEREAFLKIAETASKQTLSTILQNAPQIYDYEIDARLKDFQIDLSDMSSRDLLSGVLRTDLANLRGSDDEERAFWEQDLSDRLRDIGVILTAPLRADERLLGLMIVDRQWQPGAVREVDRLALKTFAHLAAQILWQNTLQAQEARRERDIEWENMAYYAAHECRDPINDIENLLDLLSSDVNRSETPAILEDIKGLWESVRRIKRFIHDFGSLAQCSNITVQRLPLLQVLESARDASKLSDAGVTCEVLCPDDLAVFGDSERLRGCVRELIFNATCWFDKTDKRITIEASIPDVRTIPASLDTTLRYALVRVTDNGAGIERKDDERIYDPKFTKRREQGGTGIGLYMIKRTIEAHRGMITHYSQPGEQTTFFVYLPVAPYLSDNSPPGNEKD